jgi:uncharacterized phiE125 gp8 family phage protein
MNQNYKITTAPTSEPITLLEAKTQLRIESDLTDDDVWLTTALTIVREQVEALTNRSIMPQTMELALAKFEDVIELPRPPYTSLTSITYYDEDNASQTLSSALYLVNDFVEPAQVVKESAQSYPAVYARPDAIRLTFVAGYANAAAVPTSMKQAMLMLLTDLYDNRSATTFGGSTVVVRWTPAILNLLSTSKAHLY